jgi:hypothetical protein
MQERGESGASRAESKQKDSRCQNDLEWHQCLTAFARELTKPISRDQPCVRPIRNITGYPGPSRDFSVIRRIDS